MKISSCFVHDFLDKFEVDSKQEVPTVQTKRETLVDFLNYVKRNFHLLEKYPVVKTTCTEIKYG